MLRVLLVSTGLILGLAYETEAQPRFEAFWASSHSFLYPDDKQHNPWYLDLGDINSGAAGFIGGPNVVTVMGADFCVEGCQENYPDEFCSKYPPEGIPVKPRSVDDWGTKCNISSEVISKGIAEIHARGGKVILSYGMGGISAQNGGGDRYLEEIPGNARKFARRVKKNVEDWNFDGVDFFNLDSDPNQYWDDSCPGSCQDEVNAPYHRWNRPGHSVVYHSLVIRAVREALGPAKTISYTKARPYISSSYNMPSDTGGDRVPNAVIAASHPFLDFITVGTTYDMENMRSTREEIQTFGIPLNKVGFLIDTNMQSQYWPTNAEVEDVINEVKDYGMAGIGLYHINMENNEKRGSFARMLAELLYL